MTRNTARKGQQRGQRVVKPTVVSVVGATRDGARAERADADYLIALEVQVRAELSKLGLPADKSTATILAAAEKRAIGVQKCAQEGVSAIAFSKLARAAQQSHDFPAAVANALRAGSFAESLALSVEARLQRSAGGRRGADTKRADSEGVRRLIATEGLAILSADIPKTAKAKRLKQRLGLSLSESTIRRMI